MDLPTERTAALSVPQVAVLLGKRGPHAVANTRRMLRRAGVLVKIGGRYHVLCGELGRALPELQEAIDRVIGFRRVEKGAVDSLDDDDDFSDIWGGGVEPPVKHTGRSDGRPRTPTTVRLSSIERHLLAGLAKRARMSEGEVIRGLIVENAKRQGLT